MTNIFHVELKSPEDIDKLEKMATENNVTIVNKIPLTDNAYKLFCTKESKGNALEMANLFYETGLFLSSAPEFLAVQPDCVNDEYFQQQWGLNNTGQYGGTTGMDIKYCDSRVITTGSSDIIVAVIDEGVSTDHPDLNIFHHHDAVSQTNISHIYGDHGTACIGIINAKANNTVGVSGIAPGCKLMSISTNFTTSSLAYALRYAADNGARVISNSWGSSADMPTVNSAIKYALRKGCVVVFSAGNSNNSHVNYPKASDPDILVVGAISYNGMRKNPSSPDGEYWWGSNYGSALDVMAPGVKIPTTDRRSSDGYNNTQGDSGDYFMNFNGTSSAAPHVAGVAALILSVNPNLTGKQVANVIESTARKVGHYGYSAQSGRTNGTWDDEVGYGLVDAYAAVANVPTFPAPKISPNRRTVPPGGNVTFIAQSTVAGCTFEWRTNNEVVSKNGGMITVLADNNIGASAECRISKNGAFSDWVYKSVPVR